MSEEAIGGHRRREVYYSGQVQGVGFRYTAQRLARRYDVGGYVRNLRDGRVELVAEGSASELEAFLTELYGAMRPYIRDVQTVDQAARDDFDGFDIRF